MLFFILCSVIYRSAEDNNWIYCLIFLFGIINKSKVYQNLEALIKVIVTDNSERGGNITQKKRVRNKFATTLL